MGPVTTATATTSIRWRVRRYAVADVRNSSGSVRADSTTASNPCART